MLHQPLDLIDPWDDYTEYEDTYTWDGDKKYEDTSWDGDEDYKDTHTWD